MVDLVIIVLLLLGILIGLKRGFILQIFHLFGFATALVVATYYYDKLAPHLVLWVPYPELANDSMWAHFLQALPLEKGYYNAIAFAIIFFAVRIGLQIIASMLDFVAALPILNSINRILGALLGFIEIYLLIFIILFILALTPLSFIQSWINDSRIALMMIENTPILSEKIKSLWFEL